MLPFLFDFVSPYAWLGWCRVRRERVPVAPVPVLFAGLLAASGGKGPAEIEAKRRYVFRDVARKARDLGLSLGCPDTHPFNPLTALRTVCAAEDIEQRRRVTDTIFDATWRLGKPVSTRADLADALLPEDQALLDRLDLPEVKLRLRENTDRAVAQGVFGVPTILVGSDLFWGTDAIDHALAAAAGTLAPLPADLLERWDHVQPSARRAT